MRTTRRRIWTLSVLLVLSGCAGADSDQSRPEPQPDPLPGGPVAACDLGGGDAELPATFWGMHVRDPVGGGFPDAPIGAVNLTTAQTYWNQVERAPGQYDFARLDEVVATSEDRGARPMVVLGFSPAFHTADPAAADARAAVPDPRAWTDWVAAVAERYGDRLDYQVWPEPNTVGNWTGTPEQMADLTVKAGEVIRERAPGALVVAPATTLRLPAQRRWMDRFWATSVDGTAVRDAVDAVAIDPFPLEAGSPEDALDLVCAAGRILDDRGVDLPVWTNEINYGVPSGGNATGVPRYPDEQQAAWVARTYLLHASLGIDRVYWLGWFSAPGMAIDLAVDDRTTAAGAAYARVHGWVSGGPRPTCRLDDGVYSCVASGDRGPVRLYWRAGGESPVSVPDGASVVQGVGGASETVQPGDEIDVGTSPVAVFG